MRARAHVIHGVGCCGDYYYCVRNRHRVQNYRSNHIHLPKMEWNRWIYKQKMDLGLGLIGICLPPCGRLPWFTEPYPEITRDNDEIITTSNAFADFVQQNGSPPWLCCCPPLFAVSAVSKSHTSLALRSTLTSNSADDWCGGMSLIANTIVTATKPSSITSITLNISVSV